ncbi:hypothetical protein D3C72_2458270 [compost metagenome]
MVQLLIQDIQLVLGKLKQLFAGPQRNFVAIVAHSHFDFFSGIEVFARCAPSLVSRPGSKCATDQATDDRPHTWHNQSA